MLQAAPLTLLWRTLRRVQLHEVRVALAGKRWRLSMAMFVAVRIWRVTVERPAIRRRHDAADEAVAAIATATTAAAAGTAAAAAAAAAAQVFQHSSLDR